MLNLLPFQQQPGLKVQHRGCAQFVGVSVATARKLSKLIKNAVSLLRCLSEQFCAGFGERKKLNKLPSILDNVQHHLCALPVKQAHSALL